MNQSLKSATYSCTMYVLRKHSNKLDHFSLPLSNDDRGYCLTLYRIQRMSSKRLVLTYHAIPSLKSNWVDRFD